MKITIIMNDGDGQLYTTSGRRGGKQVKATVWTDSKSKALRLFVEALGADTATNWMKDRLSESGNATDIARCSAKPGKVFVEPL